MAASPRRWVVTWTLVLFGGLWAALRILGSADSSDFFPAAALWLFLAGVTMRLWRHGGVPDRVLRALILIGLGLVLVFTVALVRTAAEEDALWEQRSAARVAAAVQPVTGAIERLREKAEERARLALVEDADLDALSLPLLLAEDPAEVGISVWEDGEVLAWSGSVPGPERAPRRSRPVIVDYGYRRYLIVRAEADDGREAYCDVDLGVTSELFPRMALGTVPGRPLSRATGVEVRVLAHAQAMGTFNDGSQVIGIPREDSWVWVHLVAPRPEQVRREQLDAESRRAAALLLLTLGLSIALGWRAWPGAAMDPRGALATLLVLLGALGIRVAMEHAQVLDLALGGVDGALRLLLEPAYFATSRAGGLLRSTLDFLLTAAWCFAFAALLFPAWRTLCIHLAVRTRWLLAALLTVASAGTTALLVVLQAMIAQNANPTLIGLDSPFFTTPFLALHAAMLLLVLAPLTWTLMGWHWWARGQGWRAWIVAALLGALLGVLDAKLLVQSLGGPWVAVLPLLGVTLAHVLSDPSFARRGLAGLIALLWFAGAQTQGLERVYTGLKESVAVQEAEQRLRPYENWRRFLLEDILRELSAERSTLDRLTDPSIDRSNEAFVVWAASVLPAQRYGCRIELRARDGGLLSEFDIGLPYEPRPLRAWRESVSVTGGAYRVDPVELATEQGPFLVYRGVLDLSWLVPEGDASRLVIDLPYAARSPATPIDLALPVTPRVMGLDVAPSLAPRRTFDRVILTGRLEGSEVVAASDARLVGLRGAALPASGEWTRAFLGGEPHRLGRVDVDDASMVVAFPESTVADRLLDLSRLTALYLLLVAVLVFLIGLGRWFRLVPGRDWPDVLGKVGFQERLLGAMLMVVLLPVFVLGVFQERRAAQRQQEDHLDEVAERLDTGLQLLASGLDDLAAALIGGEYVQEILATGNTLAPRGIGPFDRGQMMIFAPDGSVLLDETLRGLEPEDALDYLAEIESGQLLLELDRGGWYLARAYPVLGAGSRTHRVLVRRALADEDLGRVARTVRADLTVFDGAWAVVSSQAYLFKAGLRAPILPTSARPVLDGASRRVVDAREQDGLVVANGYAVLSGPGQPQRGVLSATLLGRATEAAREQQRAQLFVFGLSSLAMVLAIAVGLLLANRIVGPIRSLVGATERIGRGELDLRVAEAGSDEIGLLVRSFNRMTEDLRQSQQALASRRSFLEAMLGTLRTGVVVLDLDEREIESNPAAERLLGDGRERFRTRLRALESAEGIREGEVVLHRADGPRTLRVVVSPTQLERGDRGWLVVFDDVTELLASRRLSLYAQMARQVAHEVKNPLTPIRLSAQMIRQACADRHPRLEEIVGENVVQIEGQVERLRSIASEFSLLGQEELNDLGEVDLAPLLQEVRTLYPSPDGSWSVEVEAPDSLPVVASSGALLKVLTNLVQNALHATGESGAVRLRAAVEGGRARIEVLDQGSGIGPEVEERLFEPYFSTKSTGTGLGLVICRNLMEKMGGSISLENRDPGPGAVATLLLGLAVTPQGNPPPETT